MFKIGLDLEGQLLIKNFLKIRKGKLRSLQLWASVSLFEERILLVLSVAIFLHVEKGSLGSMGSSSVNMMIQLYSFTFGARISEGTRVSYNSILGT